MDNSSEKRLVAELLGKRVGGWQLLERLGAGKSAVVFTAIRDGREGALKIFDPDLVQRSGREKQLKRIERELSLRTSLHPNLVSVLDGGECAETHHLFIVMEKIDAPNLASVLNDVPRDAIRSIIAQVASAAKFLESLSTPIAHRDIKPDNVAISRDFKKATLLDLGVILPIDFSDSTSSPSSDEERRFFVGTLRYGPPEFLLRQEEYSVEGWRAITFYQLGAILYDLIMKERIFHSFTDPYPRLVMAVQHEIPNVSAKEVPEDLILLARNCLSKDPKIRLKYVKWADFDEKSPASAATNAKDRVRRRLAMSTSNSENDTFTRERALLRTLQDLQGRLHVLIKSGWASSEMFCPIECHEYVGDEPSTGFVELLIPATEALLLKRSLSIWFKIHVVDEKSAVVEINYAACISGIAVSLHEITNRTLQIAFAGIFQDGVVQSTILDLLYQLLDLAQTVSETDISSDIRWIEIVPQESR
jgi:serine/threonine protein kinase